MVKKLEESGVELSARFAYVEEAKADVDFPRPKGNKVSKLLNALQSRNWPTQAPAVDAVLELDWKSVTKDQIFVLGRNIYQCRRRVGTPINCDFRQFARGVGSTPCRSGRSSVEWHVFRSLL